MSLLLITGPANSAKAGEVFKRFRAHIAEQPILVVPNAADVDHYKRELAGTDGNLGGSVTHFNALLELIARKTAFPGSPLTPLQAKLLLAEAVADCELQNLAAVSGSEGFSSAMFALCDELTRARVTPRRLTGAIKQTFGEGYEAELADIYRAYTKRLARRGLLDRAGYANAVLDHLLTTPQDFRDTPLFFYGYDDLTQTELAAMELLAGQLDMDVTLSLTYEPDRPVFIDRSDAFSALAPLAGENHIHLQASPQFYDQSSAATLHLLERELFEPWHEEEPSSDTEGVEILTAGGIQAELEQIGASILAELASGVKPAEIAVIVRSPQQYANTLETVFSNYQIPFTFPREVGLSESRFGAGLLALIRCGIDPNSSATELLTYLRTPGVLKTSMLADRLDAELKANGERSLAQARELWEAKNWPLDAIDRISSAAEQGSEQLIHCLSQTAQALFSKSLDRQASLLSPMEQREIDAFTTVVNALEEWEQIVTVASVDRVLLLRQLGELTFRSGGANRGAAVQVGDPLSLRARRFEVVFIVGLQEGEFPQAASSAALLNDRKRIRLAESSGVALRLRDSRLDAERYLFYASVTRPQRRLLLSYRNTDSEGALQLRSSFIDQVEEILGELPATTRSAGEITWRFKQAPTEHERSRARAISETIVAEPLKPPEGAPLCEDLRETTTLSARALEQYSRCGVSWFVDHRLKPVELGEDAEALQFGRIVHEAIEAIFTQLQDEAGYVSLDEGSLQRAIDSLDPILDELFEQAQFVGVRARKLAHRQRMRALLVRYLRYESENASKAFKPAAFEWSFGMPQDTNPPLELGEGSLRGRIDRIDLDSSGRRAVIWDYKTSVPGNYAQAKWVETKQLQLGLYMLAVRELLGVEEVTGIYQPISGEKLKPRGLISSSSDLRDVVKTDRKSDEEIDDLLEEIRTIAQEAFVDLHSSKLKPCPKTCGYGGKCMYPGICRSEA